MIRHASRKIMFAFTLMILTTATTHIIAQSTTQPTAPSVVTGTDPVPQIDTVQLLLLIFHLL